MAGMTLVAVTACFAVAFGIIMTASSEQMSNLDCSTDYYGSCKDTIPLRVFQPLSFSSYRVSSIARRWSEEKCINRGFMTNEGVFLCLHFGWRQRSIHLFTSAFTGSQADGRRRKGFYLQSRWCRRPNGVIDPPA